MSMAFEPEMAENLRRFWLNPLEGNQPQDYARATQRSEFLVKLVQGLSPAPASILEVGCNCGRNLYHLFRAGYRMLSGIDLLDTSQEMSTFFPGFEAQFACGPAEEILPEVAPQSIDLVFTMAVLAHLSAEQMAVVAPAMAAIASQYLVTVEDEVRGWPINHARNYWQVFQPFGFRQIMRVQTIEPKYDLDEGFVARVFQREAA